MPVSGVFWWTAAPLDAKGEGDPSSLSGLAPGRDSTRRIPVDVYNTQTGDLRFPDGAPWPIVESRYDGGEGNVGM